MPLLLENIEMNLNTVPALKTDNVFHPSMNNKHPSDTTVPVSEHICHVNGYWLWTLGIVFTDVMRRGKQLTKMCHFSKRFNAFMLLLCYCQFHQNCYLDNLATEMKWQLSCKANLTVLKTWKTVWFKLVVPEVCVVQDWMYIGYVMTSDPCRKCWNRVCLFLQVSNTSSSRRDYMYVLLCPNWDENLRGWLLGLHRSEAPGRQLLLGPRMMSPDGFTTQHPLLASVTSGSVHFPPENMDPFTYDMIIQIAVQSYCIHVLKKWCRFMMNGDGDIAWVQVTPCNKL